MFWAPKEKIQADRQHTKPNEFSFDGLVLQGDQRLHNLGQY